MGKQEMPFSINDTIIKMRGDYILHNKLIGKGRYFLTDDGMKLTPTLLSKKYFEKMISMGLIESKFKDFLSEIYQLTELGKNIPLK